MTSPLYETASLTMRVLNPHTEGGLFRLTLVESAGDGFAAIVDALNHTNMKRPIPSVYLKGGRQNSGAPVICLQIKCFIYVMKI